MVNDVNNACQYIKVFFPSIHVIASPQFYFRQEKNNVRDFQCMEKVKNVPINFNCSIYKPIQNNNGLLDR